MTGIPQEFGIVSPLTTRLQNDVAIDPTTALPSWNGGSFDLTWAIEGYRRLGPGTKRT
jgi:hypothetical protein